MDEYEGYGLGKLTMTRVSVFEYPNVLTTVGKNELNPQAACHISTPLGPLLKSTHHVERLEQNEESKLGVGESLLETRNSASTLL
jgi:hypothetical protein